MKSDPWDSLCLHLYRGVRTAMHHHQHCKILQNPRQRGQQGRDRGNTLTVNTETAVSSTEIYEITLFRINSD